MSRWQQHYYTWSTNSLSQNKVGLGIVATSGEERDVLRIAENYGAKSEVLRDGNHLTIERGSYSGELPGFVRTGATPCEQGADQRNNKFVHIYSAKKEDLSHPEEYLAKMEYQKKWDGKRKLSEKEEKTSHEGKSCALAIAKELHLNKRLEELFYRVYRCLLAGERPLFVVEEALQEDWFGEFSRKMMILIHYMIPQSLRKEADYVSFAEKNNQEAHFLFGKEGGKYMFHCEKSWKGGNYNLLEQSFYKKLAETFLEEGDAFEQIMREMDHFLGGIADRRNVLEKCIFAFMSSQAGKEKEKADFFYSLERLMYWAKKEKELIPAIETAIKDLDFSVMKKEELLSYTKLLVTGAGGETKTLAYQELTHVLSFYYEKKSPWFSQLLEEIYENNPSVYQQILIKNPHTFAVHALERSIDSKEELERAVKYHKTFLEEKSYREKVTREGYRLYCKTSEETLREEIGSLAKMADEALFLSMKQKDVEQVLKKAQCLDEFLKIVGQMAVEKLEEPIREKIADYAISHGKMQNFLLPEEEEKFLALSERLSLSSYMEKELSKHYQKQIILKLDQMNLTTLFREYAKDKEEERTDLYLGMKEQLLAKRYLSLLKEETDLTSLDGKEWIRFVLRLSDALEKREEKKARDLIQATKHVVLKSNQLFLLAKVNHVLKNHGANGIHCPVEMWEALPLDTLEDFKKLYEEVNDLSLVKCTKSEKYGMAKKLYNLADNSRGRDKAEYAWKAYESIEKKAGSVNMEERGWKKLLHCALEDITSQSIWAVLLGIYGYLFVIIRENTKSPTEYGYTVGILAVLLLCYVLFTLTHERKEITPGGILYILGVGIFLMNIALAMDPVMSVVILFTLAVVLSIGMKIFSSMYLEE